VGGVVARFLSESPEKTARGAKKTGFLDMTKTTRSLMVGGVAVGLFVPLLSGCGLGVLSKTPNPDAAPNTPPVKLVACDPDNLPQPSCAQTCMDAQTIIGNDCAACHETGAIGDLTNPADYHSLSNVQASSKFPGWVYVRPGDPDHSLIYKRIAIDGDMPPPSTPGAPLPHPSVSDISVLREWIQSCIPNVPGYDAGTPPPADAGTDVPITHVYVTCSANPPTGTCSTQGMVCPYSTQTCSCDGGSWRCQSCPAAQPANGTACPATTPNGQTAVPFDCAYGNVTCNCAHGDVSSPQTPTWACGVCPAALPVNGQACGNTSISCSYDQQQCDCIDGSWTCQAPSCPATWYINTFPQSCSGFYSCAFPQLDQTCTCSGTGALSGMSCSCPEMAPKAGAFCQATAVPCSYDDQTCFCSVNGWQCTQQCPITRPADGSTCASSLNCSYGAGLCYCDGVAWHCP
jgi:hypothetical protein